MKVYSFMVLSLDSNLWILKVCKYFAFTVWSVGYVGSLEVKYLKHHMLTVSCLIRNAYGASGVKQHPLSSLVDWYDQLHPRNSR